MEEGCGWCRERETICGFRLETAFISPPLYTKRASELLEVLIFLFIQFICKHCMWLNLTVNRVFFFFLEKAQVEIFYLNSRIDWELSATQVHIHLQSNNRSSRKKRTNTLFSPRLILQLSLCWSKARILVTVFSSPSAHSCLHMTNPATRDTL